MLPTVLTSFLQLIGGYFFFFFSSAFIGSQLSSPSNIIVDTGWGPGIFGGVGVWLVGWVIARIRGQDATRYLIGTLIGGMIGWVLLLILPPTGFAGILIPIILAIIGYHLHANIL